MMFASDFKRVALDALRGNWRVAVLTGFVAALMGGTLAGGGGGVSSSNNSSSDGSINELVSSEAFQKILPFLIIFLAVIAIWSIFTIVIGGAAKLGYAKFNLNLIDFRQANFSDLFSQFDRIGEGFCMNLLVGIYTVLWTLLFIIPGIIKTYSYAMTPYILAEHPEMSANDAITASRHMMNGNKGRLFCLELSFIGWVFLALAPFLVLLPLLFIGTAGVVLWLIVSLLCVFGVGLFLRPYQEAARAAFYREVSCTFFPSTEPVMQDGADAEL